MINFFLQQNKMLEDIFMEAITKGVFPGAAIAVAHGVASNRNIEVKCFGYTGYQGDENEPVEPETFYDLASLTKPLATLPALLVLLARGELGFDDKLEDLLQRKVSREKRAIRLRHLLGHSAGLPAHLPFFEHWAPQSALEQREGIREKVVAEIMARPLLFTPGTATLYSDLGYILAGMVVEKRSGDDLAEFIEKNIYAPLGLSNQLFFNPHNHPRQVVYAPGEYCSWRQRLLKGEVGDENCALLGGVAGHAGLFGNIRGVAGLTSYLLDIWQNQAPEKLILIESDDLRHCLTKQQIKNDTTWALGMDTPSARGSSGGDLLSAASVGHLGYAGTSFWIDPHRELVVVLLTNRVHPSRFNDQIKRFRPLFHNNLIRVLDSCNLSGRSQT
ncbi:MAG TPA: class A beta-lactamase-related serine hydrolase [Desulfurivibrio alkaliphilus]|uniref:Class A beta-lactamase-related serine hydrolase n=1 Tax=Desulfurivibrio alkaliphilus TaxID=427923 RepID=A0A7C2TFU5_9BACT|nr:class A beta-lactamase-related serine hydrolase [Desulfurivibrio alkaliphilus]